MAGAIPAAQADGVIEALQADLARHLAEARIEIARDADGGLHLHLDAESSFEVESAQLSVGALQPVADCAEALRGAGAFVVQVIGHAPDDAGLALAERRAASVAAVLAAQGLPASRVRSSAGRAEAAANIELVYEPIIEGREVRAWMLPAASR